MLPSGVAGRPPSFTGTLAIVLAGDPARLQNQGMPSLELYPFRFRDSLTGKWVRARHRMQVPEMQRCYGKWEITGAPEIRRVQSASPEPFDPFRELAPGRVDVCSEC